MRAWIALADGNGDYTADLCAGHEGLPSKPRGLVTHLRILTNTKGVLAFQVADNYWLGSSSH